MIELIRDRGFAQLMAIGHAFFTRKGGLSTGIYHSLNCNETSDDKPQHVKENRRRALEHIHLSLESMVTVSMVHGSEVVIVDRVWDVSTRPKADGMVTKLKQIVLASESADCPIVLFADENAGVIGLAHAGWRGAKAGIIEETVKKMVSLGAKQNHIAAVIGPCITKDSYEVDSFFHQQFLLDDAQNKCFFSPSKKQGHYMFDLLNFVKGDLERLSLKSITAIGLDTYANEDLFFSCRRAYHRNEPNFGGHLSCLYFNN